MRSVTISAAAELRRLVRRERDGRVSARLAALAHAPDGVGREEAVRAAERLWSKFMSGKRC